MASRAIERSIDGGLAERHLWNAGMGILPERSKAYRIGMYRGNGPEHMCGFAVNLICRHRYQPVADRLYCLRVEAGVLTKMIVEMRHQLLPAAPRQKRRVIGGMAIAAFAGVIGIEGRRWYRAMR